MHPPSPLPVGKEIAHIQAHDFHNRLGLASRETLDQHAAVVTFANAQAVRVVVVAGTAGRPSGTIGLHVLQALKDAIDG